MLLTKLCGLGLLGWTCLMLAERDVVLTVAGVLAVLAYRWAEAILKRPRPVAALVPCTCRPYYHEDRHGVRGLAAGHRH